MQTYITWTHGAQPTWLQFHGPGTLLDRPIRWTASPPTPPRFPILLPPSASAPRRSRRPFTVFPSKRATRPSLSPNGKLQAFLSCLPTMSISLCSSTTRTLSLSLQVCAASAAVKHRCRILQTSLLCRLQFEKWPCIALFNTLLLRLVVIA